jgi:hypothetical protein
MRDARDADIPEHKKKDIGPCHCAGVNSAIGSVPEPFGLVALANVTERQRAK